VECSSGFADCRMMSHFGVLVRIKARRTTTTNHWSAGLGYIIPNERTIVSDQSAEARSRRFILFSYTMNSNSSTSSASEHYPTNGAHSDNSNGFHAPNTEPSPTTPMVVASDRVQYTDDAILARYTYVHFIHPLNCRFNGSFGSSDALLHSTQFC
jgi:hypothetical protein